MKSYGEEGRWLAYLSSFLNKDAKARLGLTDLLKNAAQMLEPMPVRAAAVGDVLKVQIDMAIADGHKNLFVTGYIRDETDLLDGVFWCGPGGLKSDILKNCDFLPIREAKESGRCFVASLIVPPTGLISLQQHFDVQLKGGEFQRIWAPMPPSTPVAARNTILSALRADEVSNDIVRRHVAPIVEHIHAACLAGNRVSRVFEIGPKFETPEISIVIPIYKVMEFLRYQFSAFSADPDLERCQLVFVLDSPESEIELEQRLRAFQELYGGSVKVVVHCRNFGYAPAINTGVEHSDAELVLLMNSDVVPEGAGWLSAMRKRLMMKSGRVVGVGPMLLFYDGSVQHAGLDFDRDLSGRIFNFHPGKGYPASHPGMTKARKTRALTGACLLVRKETYESVGKMSEDYVIGDFEDSDFSLRLSGLGELWVEPAAKLYHYERQSISKNTSYTDTVAALYNRWRSEETWGDSIFPNGEAT